MAFKLTKQEQTQRDAHVEQLRAAQACVEDARAVADDAIMHAINVYNDTVRVYNMALTDAEGFTDDLLSRLEEELDTRSDTWRDSEKGSDAQTFLAEWQALDFLEIDEQADLTLDAETPEHADTLESAPLEVDA